MARIENHKYSIEEAFRECFYIVPDYQREYVWTDKEVHQLLEDIGEQIDAGTTREYFIGTVLVSPTDQKNHYEVIDGQQRLTTFFLLLCALKHLFQGEPQRQMISGLISTSYVDSDGEVRTTLKLEPRYESAGEVMAKLVELDAEPQTVRAGIQSAGITSFGSLENLVNAYSTLYRYLKDNYDDTAKLKKYWGYLANNVVFIQISTDVSSALKIFETINERGVGLNPMDLLKNLLFKQVKQAQFSLLKDEWKKITKPLEKEKEKPLRFLRYFLMANYVIKNERGDAVVREDEIYDWFIAKGNAALCDYEAKPFEFVRKVIRNVDHYLAFANGLGNDGKPSLAMDSLKRLTGGAFSLHYVLLLAAANLPKPLFDHFVAQLESFLFFYIFTKTPTKDLERSFSQWADELRAIAETTDPVKQKVQLNTFVADRFEKNMAGKSQELADALKRFSLYSMQQYRTRYLLARLTQHVEMAFSGLKTPGSLEPYIKLEIEHILPDNPKAELRATWAAENPNADYDDYKNRLGNLTLLEKPINIVAGNDFYKAKQAEYGKSGNYLTRSLVALTEVGQNTSISRINAKLEAFPVWNAASIEKRHALLIALAQEVWKTTPIDV
ncbi:DUF262 domain-containing HNH endonuclease family protein [Laribacter hongkongensis]|uniref:DUF262 multi-domain protein n=1 Tax=Laribacter hongkongensis TaxID=168471 RepID=A0A248LHC0_9NEIS|nr:DUF262 domain-containing protein [Laribacter hongkongensis]ASJ23806.1 DUF262 multi-domain protein [Laribacter hongkongensis]MCG9058787.1 DUF262 domain-containing HNH endonuclease family protein [Laribacter hongkongensis]MCG9086701.1 DUF262 domain-containing HNH endonuclease family protein [Laribacter hongkongensis]MCG9100321.1 DUF262 domain-containing HNH endonuclease family protein [Laribacter hongkongensis]MCG9104032.1 DUF262 domain-containing HNH endonuclease family protein [Laribacter h